MGLNKVKGNMYGFIDYTWNPIKGRCPHNCSYCYMHPKWKYLEETGHNTRLRLDEKELKTNLGEGNFIFVGSGTDMWLGKTEWISKVLTHIAKYPNNQYLFQTKAPINYNDWTFYDNQVLCITLETNRSIQLISKARVPRLRAAQLWAMKHSRKMVTIEPIMDFDTKEFVDMIEIIKPEQVNIGADSTGNKLSEPSKEKIWELINELEKFTKVHQKPNLKRLIS